MDTQIEIENLLSVDELEAVAGGDMNLENPAVQTCLIAFLGAAGPVCGHVFTDKLALCLSF